MTSVTMPSATESRQTMVDRLTAVVVRFLPGAQVTALSRLTGGANQQMWSLDAVQDGKVTGLVLRQASDWNTDDDTAMLLDNEARLLIRAGRHGIAVPEVACILEPDDGLGTGYLMSRVEGETIPQKILRDERFSAARQRLARQCGEALAQIHRVPVDDLGFLRAQSADTLVENLYTEYKGYREPRPVFELAFRWLREHLPAAPSRYSLVHGDFRNGNLMVDESGLKSVLDWELAYVGDPMADLGWLCVPSWRFGQIDSSVGGFGSLEALFDGYEQVAGFRPDAEAVRFWEIFGILKWGVICQKMAASFISGTDTSPERGAIGRRTSETEVDLLQALVPLPSLFAIADD